MNKRDYSALIESIYAAALDDGLWPAALTAVADHLNAVDATLEIHGANGGMPVFFRGGGRLPDDRIDAYLDHYAALCPRLPHVSRLRRGATVCDYDILDERQMNRDEFYGDFLAPDGLRYFLGGVLDLPIRGLAGIYVHRSPEQGHADGDALTPLRGLMPHLSRALDLYLRLETQSRHSRSFLELLFLLPQAVVALNDRGRIVAANDAASRVFRERDGLSCRNHRLELDDRQSAKLLAATLRVLLESPPVSPPPVQDLIPVQRPSGRPPYLLAVRRIATREQDFFDTSETPALLVFIQVPGAPSPLTREALVRAFSLTPREAELAMALLQGATVQGHARALGIRVSTVRTQLKSLLRKMDLHSQLELVRLLSPFQLPR